MSPEPSTPTYSSWGRREARRARAALPFGTAFPEPADPGAWLAYGNGRSYGDSCLNEAGTLVDMRARAALLFFDPETGLLGAEAGVLLSEITRRAAPAGWFLPVTPGTQFVTLGGAIANDIHGKNHHRRGSFGRWVRGVRLLRSDRPAQDLVPGDPLFSATVGGMGMTGIVETATVQLMRVPSTAIAETTTRFDRLADYLELAEAADERHEYAVAWIDGSGRGAVRGHLICGDHAGEGPRDGAARPPFASVPLTPPISPLRGLALAAFNELYFRRAPAGTRTRTVPFDSFFYPLDRIGGWNRLYGPGGLHQHQSVVPLAGGPDAVATLIETAKRHSHGSFLTVLKRFGSLANAGVIGFAREGYTLTLDFPHRGEATLRLLDELDAITVRAGGAVNPYKDSRMSAATFAASFPRWREVEAMRDPSIVSDFWRRTALSLPAKSPGSRDGSSVPTRASGRPDGARAPGAAPPVSRFAEAAR